MAPLGDESQEEVLFLLTQLRQLIVPQCVCIGEELAFLARRDDLLDRASAIIKGNAQPVGVTAPAETISVDQQQLAARMIENTFDQHKNILRKRLDDMKAEAARWKELALGHGSVEPRRQQLDRQTQTLEEDSSPHATSLSGALLLLSLENEWFGNLVELSDEYHTFKAESLLQAFSTVSRSFTTASCKLEEDLPFSQTVTERTAAQSTSEISAPPLSGVVGAVSITRASAENGPLVSGMTTNRGTKARTNTRRKETQKHRSPSYTSKVSGGSRTSETVVYDDKSCSANNENMLYAISSLRLATRQRGESSKQDSALKHPSLPSLMRQSRSK